MSFPLLLSYIKSFNGLLVYLVAFDVFSNSSNLSFTALFELPQVGFSVNILLLL